MLSATINFFKCVTKSRLKGFVVIQPITLHKLPLCNSICFLVILYSFPLVDVCRLLHIWIQLETTLYVNLIICLYMYSAETQLLIRVWVWLSIFKLLCPFTRQSSITWIPAIVLTLAFREILRKLGHQKVSEFVLISRPNQGQSNRADAYVV